MDLEMPAFVQGDSIIHQHRERFEKPVIKRKKKRKDGLI